MERVRHKIDTPARTGSHLAGSDIAGHVVQELAGLLLNRDVVVDVAEREDIGRALERVGCLLLLLLLGGTVDFSAVVLGSGLSVAVLGRGFDGLDELGRGVATTEEHDAAGRGLVLLVLVSDEVDTEEEREERPDLCEWRSATVRGHGCPAGRLTNPKLRHVCDHL